VNGPAATNFDTTTFVNQYPGWLRDYEEYAAEDTRTGAEIIDYVAANYSVSPRVLLAILEHQSSALSSQIMAPETKVYPLGYEDETYRGLYLQLVWAANILNNAYYGWRTGNLISFELQNGQIEQPDPWQNASSVALQVYFNQALPASHYQRITSPNGFSRLYASLFGDPWNEAPHIPGSLRQPEFRLPFEPDKQWTFTGGPHVGWGSPDGRPLSALDFAPPSEESGCVKSDEWATAIADGIVVRSERGMLVLDLDGDGDERTGWVIFYLHMEARERAQIGTYLKAGDFVGHPSCEGGITTGSHVHIARKYNGEWLPAAGALPFVMENWVPQAGNAPYQGSMTRFGRTVVACECSSEENQLSSTIP
jgi:murein DD-endopeptidase MepM/ murein hydrolase activator NlpD